MGKVLFLKKGSTHTAPKKPLNNCTWQEIRAISDSGNAANYFAVGDTKTIVINGTVGVEPFSNLSIDAFILGFNHNASVEGTNRIHFGLGKINGVDVCLCDANYSYHQTASGKFTMNTSATNSGGWYSSRMRKTVLGSDSAPTSPTANTLLAALSSDLRAVMKSIVKRTDNTGGGSNTASYVTNTTDYLPLLSEFEVHGTRSVANSAEQNYQQQYAYFAAGNSKVKNKHNATTTAAYWWLRSPHATNASYFCSVGTSGATSGDSAYTSRGVAPCFAV